MKEIPMKRHHLANTLMALGILFFLITPFVLGYVRPWMLLVPATGAVAAMIIGRCPKCSTSLFWRNGEWLGHWTPIAGAQCEKCEHRLNNTRKAQRDQKSEARTQFKQLNDTWHADPNAPTPKISVNGDTVELRFLLNPFLDNGATEGDTAIIRFVGCAKYGFSDVNDEAWYRGECRFSQEAPRWGEFYEVTRKAKLGSCTVDWQTTQDGCGTNHFLFYFRDNTFECFAESWELVR